MRRISVKMDLHMLLQMTIVSFRPHNRFIVIMKMTRRMHKARSPSINQHEDLPSRSPSITKTSLFKSPDFRVSVPLSLSNLVHLRVSLISSSNDLPQFQSSEESQTRTRKPIIFFPPPLLPSLPPLTAPSAPFAKSRTSTSSSWDHRRSHPLSAPTPAYSCRY